jgi:hypothetical protein
MPCNLPWLIFRDNDDDYDSAYPFLTNGWMCRIVLQVQLRIYRCVCRESDWNPITRLTVESGMGYKTFQRSSLLIRSIASLGERSKETMLEGPSIDTTSSSTRQTLQWSICPTNFAACLLC